MDTRPMGDDRGIFLGSDPHFYPSVSMAVPSPNQGIFSGGLHHPGTMYRNLDSPHRSMRTSPVPLSQSTLAGHMSNLPAHFQGAEKCFPPPPHTVAGPSSGSSYSSCLPSFIPPSRSPDLFKHHHTDVGPPPHSLPISSHYWPHPSEGLHLFSPSFYPYLPLTALHQSVPGRIGPATLTDTNLPSLLQPPSHEDLMAYYHYASKDEPHKEHVKGHIGKSEHKSKRTNEFNKKKSDKSEIKDLFKGSSNHKHKLKSSHEKDKSSSELSQISEMQLNETVTENKSVTKAVEKTRSEMSNQNVENKAKDDVCDLVSERIYEERHHYKLIDKANKLKEENAMVYSKQSLAKECIQDENKILETSESLTQASRNVLTNMILGVSENVHLESNENIDKTTTDFGALPTTEKSNKLVTSSTNKVEPLQSVTKRIALEVAPVLSPSIISVASETAIKQKKNTSEAFETDCKKVVRENKPKTSPSFTTVSSPVNSVLTSNNVAPLNNCFTDSSKLAVASGVSKASSLTSVPLYVNGTGCLTVERESYPGLVRDGTKVHATTFVPAMGDYIPTFGSGSAHREARPKSNPLLSGFEYNKCKISVTSTESKDGSSKSDLQKQTISRLTILQSTDSIKVENTGTQDSSIDLCTDSVIFTDNHNAKTNQTKVQTITEDTQHSSKDQHIKSCEPIPSSNNSGENNKHLKHTNMKVLESQQGRCTPSGKAPPPVGIAVAQKRQGSKDSTSSRLRSRDNFALHTGSRPSSADVNPVDAMRSKNDTSSTKHESIDVSRLPSNNQLGSNLIVTGGEDYRKALLVKSDSATPTLTPEHHWYSRMAAGRPPYRPGNVYGIPSTHPATYNPTGVDSTQGQVPLPPPGWQLGKDPATGQLLWVPAIDAGAVCPYLFPPSHPLLMNQHIYGISHHERQEQMTREYQVAIQLQHQAYVDYVRKAHEKQEQHKPEKSHVTVDYGHTPDQDAKITHCHPYLPGVGHLGLPSVYPGHEGTQYVFDPATRAFIPVPSPSISVDEKHRPKPSSSRGSSVSELASPRSTSHSVNSECKGKIIKKTTANVKSISVQTSMETSMKDEQPSIPSTKVQDKETKNVEENTDNSDCEVIDVDKTHNKIENEFSPVESKSVTFKHETKLPVHALDLSMKTDNPPDSSDYLENKTLDNTETLTDNECTLKLSSLHDQSAGDFDRSEDVTCAMQALLNLTAGVCTVETTKKDTPNVEPDVSEIDTSYLASLGGIALLSAVAQQKAFHDYSFSQTSDDNESIKEEEPIEKLTGNIVSSADSQSANELLYKQRLAKIKKDEQNPGCDDRKLSGDVMHPNELEMRMKMAEIQRKYKERKREWDRLQRRKLKKVQKVDNKKSPGRPKKRKCNPQQGPQISAFPTHPLNAPSSTEVLLKEPAQNSTMKTKLNTKLNAKPTEFSPISIKKKNVPMLLKAEVKSPKLPLKINSGKDKVSNTRKTPTEQEAGNQIVLETITKAVKKSTKHITSKNTIPVASVKKPEVQYSQVYGDSDTDESEEGNVTLNKVSFTKASTDKPKVLKSKNKKRSSSELRDSVVKKKKKRKDESKSDKTESKKDLKKIKNQTHFKALISEDKKEPLFDEEVWSKRRRSERIFLNDTSPVASRDVSPINKKQANQPDSHIEKMHVNVCKQGRKSEIVLPSQELVNVLDALTTDPLKMRKKLERLSGRGCDDQAKKLKKTIEKKAVHATGKQDYSDDDDDEKSMCDSDSENLPLSVLRERPVSPIQRSCAILPEELSHGLRVLIPIDNLFYPGYVRPIQPPDVYGVIIDGQRGNRPHVFSQEQMLKEAILDVKPKSVRYLPEGSRICAYWSQQYRCLYPGTVVKGSPNPTVTTNFVSVEFDDGDSGRILIDDIRLLPPDYPVLDIEPSTVLLERRRRRKTSSISANGVGSSLPKQNKIQEEISNSNIRLLSECEGDDEVFIQETPPMKSSKKEIQSAKRTYKKKKNKELRKLKKEDTLGSHNLLKKSQQGQSDVSRGFRDGRKSKKKSKKLKPKGKKRKETRKVESRKRKYKNEKNKKNPEPPNIGSSNLFVTPFVDSSDTVDSVTDGENLDMQLFPDVIESDSDNNFSDSSTEDPEMKLMIAESKRRHYRQKSKNKGYRRRFWQWSGKSTQRRGIKGKAKKLFYKAISRGDENIRVGECAVFLSTGRPHLPYIGRIESIWESWGGNMVVRVKWFYHPEETKGGRRPQDGKMALYLSPHVDENDVQTISHKCEVISVDEYNHRLKKNNGKFAEDIYYFAGTYDPTNGHLVPVSQIENKI